MNVIERMREKGDFTHTEQTLINLMLKDPTLMLSNPTAAQLGKAAFTSASTVVRLCKKLGCDSFSAFKTQFVAEFQQNQGKTLHVDADLPFSDTDAPEKILDQLTSLEEIAIRQTRSVINVGTYQAAVAMLNDAQCIDVYGAGENVQLLQDFSYKMGTIHHQVRCHLDNQKQLLSAATKYLGHCAVLVSYSGESRSTIHCAQLLKENRTPTLSITCQKPNQLANLTDLNLYIATLESQAGANVAKLGTFTSNISILTMMNYLYAGVFQHDYARHYGYLKKDRAIFLADR